MSCNQSVFNHCKTFHQRVSVTDEPGNKQDHDVNIRQRLNPIKTFTYRSRSPVLVFR